MRTSTLALTDPPQENMSALPAGAPRPTPAAGVPPQRRRFLVVDDERIVAEDISECLASMGGEVIGVAITGRDAVRLALEHRPDLILMDIILQGDMDGIEAAAQIRRQWDIPVVFLTAYSDQGVLERAKAVHPAGYLVKPFDEAGLRSTIEIALHQSGLERAIRDNREWFVTILTSMADGVIVADAAGQIAFMNPAAEGLTGWSALRVHRQPVANVNPIYDAATGRLLPHPSLAALGGQDQMLTEVMLRRTDGALVAAEVSARPVKNASGQATGAVVLLRDVTVARQAALQLRHHQQHLESMVAERTRTLEETNRRLLDEIEERARAEASLAGRARLESLLNDLSSDFLALPPGQNAAHWQAALEKIGRASAADAAALYLLDDQQCCVSCAYEWCAPEVPRLQPTFHNQPLPAAMDEMDGMDAVDLKSPKSNDVLAAEIARARGMAKVAIVPLIERERLLGYLSLESAALPPWPRESLDLLDMAACSFSHALHGSRAEREKGRLQEQLTRAQRMEAVGRLSGGIAHDFNNTLLPIIGYADLLLERLPAGGEHTLELAEIRRAAQHAATLTRQLLAFSKKQVASKVRLDLHDELKSMNNLLQRIIGENIRLETDLDSTLPAVLADPGQLQQVVMNLIVNARDAMPAGGSITIRTHALPPDGDGVPLLGGRLSQGPLVCLTVKDTGAGIPPELHDRIFDPFFTTKGSDGTGLGLSVIYSIVEQHGGGLEVDSAPGLGTAFHVYLPATGETVTTPTPAPIEREQLIRGAGQRLLLIEDEEAVNRFVTTALSQHGYEVIPAKSVGEAWSVFESEDGRFDMIFSDAVLPDGNGVDLIDRVLACKPGLPALLSSGYTDKDGLLRLAAEREISFLQKPYSLPELLHTVDGVLKGTHCAVLN